MPDVLAVALAGAATALATGLGAVPVFFLGARAAAFRPALWGLAAGVMAVASWEGLLAPALDDGSPAEVAGGLAAGVAFLAGFWVLATHVPLIGDANEGLVTWPAAIWHSIAAVPTLGLAVWCVVRSIPEP